MITDEHFAALAKVREEAEKLRLACLEADQAGSLLHMAFDRDISLRLTNKEELLLGKLRAIQ